MDSRVPDNKFNEQIIDIGSRLFDLQIVIAAFVVDLFREMDRDEIEIDIFFPVFNGEKYETINGILLFYDPENDIVKVKALGRDEPLLWNDIGIAAQEEVANELHFKYTSLLNYIALKTENESH